MLSTNQNVGENTLAESPRLNRRTAATKMAENGETTILDMQIAGGWKSERIARRYIEKSKKTKVKSQV